MTEVVHLPLWWGAEQYAARDRVRAAARAWRRAYLPARRGRTRASGRHPAGRGVSGAVLEPGVRVEHVTRTLAGEVPVTLVDDVSLEIERGEFVCDHGTVGFGQVVAAVPARPARRADARAASWLDGEDTSRFDEDELADRRLAQARLRVPVPLPAGRVHACSTTCMLPMRRLGRLDPDAGARARGRELLDRSGRGRPARTSGRTSCPAASASASRSRARWPTTRSSSSPTSRPAISTRPSAPTCAQILRELAHEHGKTVIAVTHDGGLRRRRRPAHRPRRRPHRPVVEAAGAAAELGRVGAP